MTLADIVDSHVHFWDPGVLEYPWLAELPALDRPFLPPDLDGATGEAPVLRVVFVEANARSAQALDEVLFAEAVPEVAGIVAYAALDRKDTLAERLDELCARPKVKGLRHNIQGHPPGFALQPFFVDGVREAGRRGLSFDLCATHDQLGELAELCRLCPDTALVLDHCGKPPIRSGALEPWAAAIRDIAALEHVRCKLSGLLTQADPASRSEEQLVLFAEHAIGSFGPERVMYGSDWPVLTLAGNYGSWYRFTRRLAGGWSDAETRAFYRDNALAFYRL